MQLHTSSLDARSEREPLFTPRFCLLLAVQTVFGFGWSLYLLAPKFLATALQASATEIGQVMAMGGVAGVLSVPLAASGIDRFGRRLFFQIGSAFIVLLSLLYLSVERMSPLVYFAQGCTGAAFVLAFNGSATLVADLAPRARLGQAIGVLGAANMSMNAIATMIAEPLAERFGWAAVFRLGALTGLTAIALSFMVREPARPAPGTGQLSASEHPVAREPVPLLLLATLLSGSAFAALFVFYQPYALSLGAREVRSFFVGFTFSAVLARVGFGELGDRFGHRRVSLGAGVLYAGSALLMTSLDPGRLWLYGAVFGLAHGVLYPTLNALVLSAMPATRRGRAMTFYNGAFNVGSASSAFGWGVLAEHAGYPPVFYGATVAALLCVGTLASARPRAASAVGDAGAPVLPS